jgi:hypothetical protein
MTITGILNSRFPRQAIQQMMNSDAIPIRHLSMRLSHPKICIQSCHHHNHPSLSAYLDLCLIFRRFLFSLLMRFFFHWRLVHIRALALSGTNCMHSRGNNTSKYWAKECKKSIIHTQEASLLTIIFKVIWKCLLCPIENLDNYPHGPSCQLMLYAPCLWH